MRREMEVWYEDEIVTTNDIWVSGWDLFKVMCGGTIVLRSVVLIRMSKKTGKVTFPEGGGSRVRIERPKWWPKPKPVTYQAMAPSEKIEP